MEGLETSASVVKEKEEALRQLEEEHARRQEEIQRQIAELEQAAEQASQTRSALAGQLSRDLIQRYELIFSRRGGTAVVAVADGICQGCYMNIPPQLWNEIIKSDRLNLCPSCHRILYHKPAAPNDKQI
jgi:predicted  nucleic acid-binding Zn-ribbon protein